MDLEYSLDSKEFNKYHFPSGWNSRDEYRVVKCRKLLTREVKLEPESTVLEIGFGYGRESLWFASSSFNIVAVEIIGKLCKGTKLNFKRGEFGENTAAVVEADGRYLPFRENSFDLVYCKAVLHHVPNVRQITTEMYRVAKRNGSAMAIDEPTKLNPLRGLAKLLEQVLHFKTYSLSAGTESLEATFCSWQLREYFAQAGFDRANSGSMWLPYCTTSKVYFRVWLLLEKLVERTFIPCIFGQLFVTGKK